jgi:hypothetical protein
VAKKGAGWAVIAAREPMKAQAASLLANAAVLRALWHAPMFLALGCNASSAHSSA